VQEFEWDLVVGALMGGSHAHRGGVDRAHQATVARRTRYWAGRAGSWFDIYPCATFIVTYALSELPIFPFIYLFHCILYTMTVIHVLSAA
jgi:hypothetical protein